MTNALAFLVLLHVLLDTTINALPPVIRIGEPISLYGRCIYKHKV